MEPQNDEKWQKYHTNMAEYIHNKYHKMLHLSVIKNTNLAKYLLTFTKSPYSSRRRFTVRSQIMKYLFPTETANMIAAGFKMTYDDTTCIYAYLYSTCIDGKITNKYICTGPTYDSRDGEYRSRYILWDQFQQFISVYSDIIDMVEPMILAKMQSTKLQYHLDFYYPELCKPSREYEDSINDARLPIMFHILCWLVDFHYFHNKFTENHVNSAYLHNIYQREDADLYNQIVELLTPSGYLFMKSHIENWTDEVTKNINRDNFYPTPIQLGQKIIPISILESIHPDDIRFAAWREKEFTAHACDLMINLIAPGFPLIINWSYINNAGPDLFDNVSMHDKYRQSEIAKRIVEQLDTLDKMTHEVTGGDNNDIDISSDSEDRSYGDDWVNDNWAHDISEIVGNDSTEEYMINNDHINNVDTNDTTDISDLITDYSGGERKPAFSGVQENLKAAAISAGRDVILSDLAICMRMEHMGRTLRNLPILVAAKATVPELMKTYSDPAVFNKHIFEFMYNAHCMNTHIHLIHGDAHLNNVTVAWIMKLFYEGKLAVENPTIIYILDGICYAFPHYGTFASFIDLSRALLGSESAIVHDYGNLYAHSYFEDQKIRMMNVIIKLAPEITNISRLETLIEENLALVFKAIASVDVLTITRSLTKLFESDESFIPSPERSRFIPVDDSSKQLLIDVANAAHKILIMNLTAIIDGTVTSVADFEWPNHILIKQFFSAHEASEESLAGQTVIDFFNHSNPLKYTIYNYDKWGPLLNVDYDTEMRKKFGVAPDPDLKHWLEHIATDETIELDHLLSTHKSKAHGIYKNDQWMQL